jgi:hypothetical protein
LGGMLADEAFWGRALLCHGNVHFQNYMAGWDCQLGGTVVGQSSGYSREAHRYSRGFAQEAVDEVKHIRRCYKRARPLPYTKETQDTHRVNYSTDETRRKRHLYCIGLR